MIRLGEASQNSYTAPMWSSRIVSALLISVVAWVAISKANVAQHSPPQFETSAAGQCLVASPRLAEPTFAQSVIVVVVHNNGGAMGLIVNRVLGKASLNALASAFGIRTHNRKLVDVYLGGPVELGLGFVLHSDDYQGMGTQRLNPGLSVSTGLDVIKAMSRGQGPKRSRFLLGYAGWGPGQLELELARGDWLLAPADGALIFAADPKTVWQRALRQAGIPL